MANSVDPDETARYEPSHQDLHCLQGHQIWSAGLKGLRWFLKQLNVSKLERYTVSISNLFTLTEVDSRLCFWTWPLLRIGISVHHWKQNGKQCKSWWNGSLGAVSPGSTLAMYQIWSVGLKWWFLKHPNVLKLERCSFCMSRPDTIVM